MIPELPFLLLPPGAILANVSEANSPTFARENKTMFGGGRVKYHKYPHFENEETEAQRA